LRQLAIGLARMLYQVARRIPPRSCCEGKQERSSGRTRASHNPGFAHLPRIAGRQNRFSRSGCRRGCTD